jgi:hypothetical protein
MKARLLLTSVLLAVSAGALTGCVVYPEPVGVAVQPSVVVRPAPYYYGYGPRYRYYNYGPRHGGW